MGKQKTELMQYFSKWRKEWIDFSPTKGELISLKKYHYQVRIKKENGI